jgi:SAM-dependent methyltransferase
MIRRVSEHPVPDRTAAAALGVALRGVGYSEDALHELLGDEAYSTEREDVPAEERRLPQTRLATVVRAFFLQLPVSSRDAVDALGERAVEALAATALADVGDEVLPRARILPIGKVLLASDGYSRDAEDPPDYVATYTPTARTCDSLTPRPRVARALDVGTGSGIHALLAAQHAREVIATDVNARALAYTELNAALNGLTNVECRHGSLFDPVAGETFDLVTCNAPYVVSPERRWAYRDSGLEADQFSERVVREAAEHLAEGGFATLLVSWLANDEDSPDERVMAWAEATGCDSWILSTLSSDPLTHAEEWNSHLVGDPKAFGEALDEWTRYFDGLGVRRVSEGAVLLHRRPGAPPTSRVDSVDEDALDDAGEQIQRAFEARAMLAGLRKPEELLDARLSVAAALRLERDLEPQGGRAVDVDGRVEISEGTQNAVDVTADVQEVVAMLDPALRLREVIGAAADRLGIFEEELPSLREEALDVTRELLELGALRVH